MSHPRAVHALHLAVEGIGCAPGGHQLAARDVPELFALHASASRHPAVLEEEDVDIEWKRRQRGDAQPRLRGGDGHDIDVLPRAEGLSDRRRIDAQDEDAPSLLPLERGEAITGPRLGPKDVLAGAEPAERFVL